MSREIKYWEPVFNAFCEDYPNLAEEWIDWYPSGQMEITVKIPGGKKYLYDFMKRVAYPICAHNEGNNISEEEWRKRFARRLSHKMYNVSVTQDSLSELTGISQVMISKYVNGKSVPNVYNLHKIARALNCSTSELMNI